MKRLREMVLEDLSSSEKEEDDDDFGTILGMIFNDDVRRPRRGYTLTAYTSTVIERRAMHSLSF